MTLDPPGLLPRAELPNILDNVTMIETYYDNMWESQCWAILTAEKHRFCVLMIATVMHQKNA